MSSDTISHTLPIGYILNDRYCIDAILGEGGFGITYKAIDKSARGTRTYTAIKEYYPSGIAAREVNGDNAYCVTHFDGKLAVSFRKGLNRFRQEAYLLKKFQNLQSIVTVLDIFDENNTTYIVMGYIEGLTIQKLVKKDGPMKYSDLLSLMKPLLADLITIHENGLIHRDISPDNLLIGMDNRLHLIDFGSANHSNINATKTFTVILKAGYAPPEQYIPHGKIGAWTDVYGICATMFYALTGQIPTDSLQRMQSNNADIAMYELLNNIAGLEKYQRDCIMQGLSLRVSDRYPSINIFLNTLTTPPEKDIITEMPLSNISGKRNGIISFKHMSISFYLKKVATGVILLCIIAGAAWGISLLTTSTVKDSHSKEGNSSSAAFSDNNSDDIESATEGNIDPTNIDNILTMVNLSGKTLKEASEIVHNLDSDIVIQTTEEYSEIYNKGIIISQSIHEDTQFTKGDINSIVLTISLGEKLSSENTSSEKENSGNRAQTDSTETAINSTQSSSTEAGSNSTQYNNAEKTSGKKKTSGTNKNDGYTTIHIGD